MNILYESLPDCVTVNGQEYSVITDFREWIRFSDMLEDEALDDKEKGQLMLQWYADEIPPDFLSAVQGLNAFFHMAELQPEEKQVNRANQSNKGYQRPVFSYRWDAGFVVSAFLDQYQIDLLEIDYLHWWKFRMLFAGLDENCELRQRIAYRSINVASIKNKKERARIQRIQHQIALPSRKMDAGDVSNVFGSL